MIAVLKIRADPCYRRQAFERGLQGLGFDIRANGTPSGPDDWLVQWNRKPPDEPQARAWEAAGGTVLVCENGYIGRDDVGRQLYAISVHGHNGAGWFPVNHDNRFAKLNIEPAPWRKTGSHLLIAAQRGIGSPQMASPPNWHINTEKRLRATTKRPVRVRLHPGNAVAKVPLEDDLADAYACVVWSSASGVRALTLGVPVLYDAPHWICEYGARNLTWVENPLRSDERRAEALHRMAHGQWTVAEIEAGIPFARIRERLTEATW